MIVDLVRRTIPAHGLDGVEGPAGHWPVRPRLTRHPRSHRRRHRIPDPASSGQAIPDSLKHIIRADFCASGLPND
jgi:hypothetical protein